MSSEQVFDKKWHHFSLTFSGQSGVITQYLEGVKKKSETGIAQELDGGGTLEVGERIQQAYQFTGFNLWKKILPEEEIRDLATSCFKGIGNVKHWSEFSDKAKAITNMKVISPSVCHPPGQAFTEPKE